MEIAGAILGSVAIICTTVLLIFLFAPGEELNVGFGSTKKDDEEVE